MSVFKKFFIFVLIISVYVVIISSARAHVASSTNYRIQFDSVNTGGIYSTSSNYKAQDSAGEIATENSTSTSYKLYAGFQQMNETYLAITSPSDVSMTAVTAIDRVGNGSAEWTVTTDSPSGYTLAIKAGSNPALFSGSDSFSDYTPSGVDYTWSVNSSSAEFGFTPEGSHITSTYKDNGSSCGSGSSDTASACWDAFSTTNKTIASSSSGNHPSGTATTVRFRSEMGANRSLPTGNYSTTITVTVLAQ